MPNLNKAFLIGHAGGDPSVQTLKGGSTVARFSLAVNYGEKVEWLSIVAWDKLADVTEKYIRKGSSVFVEGRIQTRKYETKEGESRTVTEIIAQNIQLLDRLQIPADERGFKKIVTAYAEVNERVVLVQLQGAAMLFPDLRAILHARQLTG